MKKILKSSGYCCDGCQWQYCDFYRTEATVVGEILVKDGTNDLIPQELKEYKSYCDMFAGVQLYKGSCNICNKVYGDNYDGYP